MHRGFGWLQLKYRNGVNDNQRFEMGEAKETMQFKSL